jgi:hypothetical protein
MPTPSDTTLLKDMLQKFHSEVLQKLVTLEAKVEQSLVLSQENNRALKGANGGTGLIAKVERLADQTERGCQETLKRMEELEELLFDGTEDEPGLVEQVHELRRWQKGTKYWTALLIGATLVGIINIVIQVALHPILTH